MIVIIALFCGCTKKNNVFAFDDFLTTSANSADTILQFENPTTTVEQTNEQLNYKKTEQTDPLKKLLSEASWESIDEAKRLGKSALQTIRPFLKHENYQVRQMAVNCAGTIGDNEGADILASGLKDCNINVRLAAARELAKQGYPAAIDTILKIIKKSPNETVREFLVTAAGHLPGDKTIATLRPLARGKSVLADNAIYTLAKLGDSSGRKLVSNKLSAPSPRTRYETLQNLCYINDMRFASRAEELLMDKTNAIRVGSVRNPRMRRVADGAVDSLVCLLNLDLPFKPSKKIYTNEEIIMVRDLINKK